MSEKMITWELGADRIVVLTIDDPARPTNTMSPAFEEALREAVDRLEAEKEAFDGVILTSGKETFFAGGDLEQLMNAGAEDAPEIAKQLDAYKEVFRRLELLGRPVVAALNGAALGGGLEVALACHHRIAIDKRGAVFGLPEVQWGLLPGAGGVTRVVRMLGVLDAINKVVGQGQRYQAEDAFKIGIVDEVVSDEAELLAHARAWIRENPDASQPWDRPGYRIPASAGLADLPAYPANIRKRLKGAPLPAPIAVVATAVEGAQVDIDTAFAIETRYCTNLVCGTVSTNLIKTMFFDMNALRRGSRGADVQPRRAEKVLVVGGGMMGAGIAFVTARSGAQVVLKDVTIEAADRGKAYSERILDKVVAKGTVTAEDRDQILARITPTADMADARGCDLVVEAVFEDPELKKKVFAELEPYVAADALLGSNTSTLPITELSSGVERDGDFIGLHFFSPVDKMPLLEIVVGERTSEGAVARAVDYARQIRMTPIVVNDSRGFFTSRVIGQFMDEAVAMVAEGVHPVSVEQAATQAGYPVGALALTDEINMKLTQKIRRGLQAHMAAEGKHWVDSPGYDLVDAMVEKFDRPGRLEGRGFFEYDEKGARTGIWPELVERYTREDHGVPFIDVQERMLFAEALDSARCLEEGVLRSVAEANVGSIVGIGFPAWTGGVIQYINQYEGGVAGFVARADQLQERYGDRFMVPTSLREQAAAGKPLV